MPYDIHADLIGSQALAPVPQDLTLHSDDDPITGQPYGRLISKDAYVAFFKNYLKPVGGSTPNQNSIVAFRFNRSILLQILAFQDCESICFCKSINNNKETMVAVALDKNKQPLGWKDPNDDATYNPKEFVAAEWIHGIKYQDASGHIIGTNNFSDKNDFKSFFESL